MILKDRHFFMIKITSEDLIRYLYNETSTSKTARIEEALQIDSQLRDEFEKIKSTYSSLKDVSLSPRQESVDKILEYASKMHKQIHSF